MNSKEFLLRSLMSVALLLILGACAAEQAPAIIPTHTSIPSTTSTPTEALPSPTLTLTPSPTTVPTQTPTPTQRPTDTPPPPYEPFVSCAEVDEIPVSECEALVALAEATSGGTPSYWFQSNTPCNWGGIDCVDGHVNHLQISDSIWIDPIPSAIEKLKELEILSIYGGTFTSLPPEIGNLKNMRMLVLSLGQLSGCIPPVLGNLENLTTLILYDNQLECSIPPELGNLTKLRRLELQYNQLTGPIPPELGNLRDMRNLDLSGNQLTGPIPPEIGNLTKLYDLLLGDNELEGEIPAAILNLQSISTLWLDGNRLYSTNLEVTTFLEEKAPGWAEKQGVEG